MSRVLLLLVAGALVNNVVLSRFLGLCSFVGVSKKKDTSVGMGGAVIFVITLATILCAVVYACILKPLGIDYLQTIVFILLVASLVQFIEMFMKKNIPSLHAALGIFLPLITTNCAVLGVALDNVQKEYNFIEGLAWGVGTALGYTIAIVILASIRERIEGNDIPKYFQGMPMVLITSCLMAIAFTGFSGMVSL
ncbi:MAG: RnfABCDGE type electron transport complex subunit A [Stomatobaculum sp.]|jgi:electron transport complex protein RnfA|nr:RnfABCDGE type electron transport complex subunit A [Stomatobaculum sp.]